MVNMMINGIKNILADLAARRKLVFDSSRSSEQRCFAALEFICFPLSLLTLFVLMPFLVIVSQYGFIIDPIWRNVMDVMLSAAIGYITNYIAIEMLFKPYKQDKRHPLSIITFGYWKQGLVPKNKSRIGKEAGQQIEGKLLNPDKMADELCEMVMGFVQNPGVMDNLRDGIQDLVQRNEKAIVGFIVSKVEESLVSALGKIVTSERLCQFWEEVISPQLTSGTNRELIANHITESLQRKSPQFIEVAREEIRKFAFDYLNDNMFTKFAAKPLSDGLVEFICWNDIERRLRYKLGDENTMKLLEEELLICFDKFTVWIKSPESTPKIEAFANTIRAKVSEFLRSYINDTLPELAIKTMQSEELWNWIQKTLLPSLKVKIETLIKTYGKDKIIEKLNLSHRIAEAVDKQDVKEFHDMINSVAAEHLGAIQVLGYILGGIVGLAQIFM